MLPHVKCSLLLTLFASGLIHADDLPMTGPAVPGMESVDRVYSDFMEKYGIPGGSVAVMKDGRVVYSRGFGWADRDKKEPVQPETPFRIASISKPITSLLVTDLVQQGKLSYDLKAFPYLEIKTPTYRGAERDPRLDLITIRHLLQHSAGWNRDTALSPKGKKGFDPMFYPNTAAWDLTGKSFPPADANRIVEWMAGKPLQADPGAGYAYSNLGYNVLGRIIEKATGQPYEDYARKVLSKAGITGMRIGGGRLRDLAPGETHYYDIPGVAETVSVWNEPDTRMPYANNITSMDSHGGWIASPEDLVRFTTLFDGRPDPEDLLSPETVALMRSRPSFSPPAAEKSNYYGFGWKFWESKDATTRNWYHSGSLPGTMSMLIRSDNGVTWAAVFNLRPRESGAAFKDLDETMWKAVNGVTEWPEFSP